MRITNNMIISKVSDQVEIETQKDIVTCEAPFDKSDKLHQAVIDCFKKYGPLQDFINQALQKASDPTRYRDPFI